MKKILVAGGAGYIGSHMVRALIGAKYIPVVFDDLSTGHRAFIPKQAVFVRGDLRDARQTARAFTAHRIDAVMHFAASSLVGESVRDPLKYYENNVSAGVNLLKCMLARKVTKLVFSSTCAVYGVPQVKRITEDLPKLPVNPYGRSKLAIEHMLADVAAAHGLRYVALRYFNAAGADASGTFGEWHKHETHLIPNVLAALRSGGPITVFGDDYPTPDGTCVRDYIHVDDLCRAHLAALGGLNSRLRTEAVNLGLGKGYSVLEVIRTAEEVTGLKARIKIGPRRPGDPPVLIASASKAARRLGWRPRHDLRRMITDAWRWELSGTKKK